MDASTSSARRAGIARLRYGIALLTHSLTNAFFAAAAILLVRIVAYTFVLGAIEAIPEPAA